MSIPNPFIFKRGDVRILVTYKGKEIVGSVCSQAMVLASPAWEKFVFPPWENQEIASTTSSSTPGQEKAINFTEDNGEALLVLLNIAHLQFCKVPDNQLHYDLLYNLACLIDLHQCIDLVKSYKSHWVSGSRTQMMMSGQQGWFFIAYVFGLEELFEEAARRLVKELRTDEEGKWYTGELTSPERAETMKLGFLEPLKVARKAVIEQLYGIVSNKLEYYSRSALAGNSSRPPRCQQSVKPGACDAAILGSIVLRLEELNLFPFPSPDSCHLSVNEVASLIRSLDLSIESLGEISEVSDGWGGPPSGGWGSPPSNHSRCFGRSFNEMATAILNQIKPPVENSHRVHMQRQRGESLTQPERSCK